MPIRLVKAHSASQPDRPDRSSEARVEHPPAATGDPRPQDNVLNIAETLLQDLENDAAKMLELIMDERGGVQLGHRLAQLRERTGMKQAELARKITWSPAVLSRIEAGDRSISDEELATLLDAIGTGEAADLSEILQRDWQYLPTPPLDHPDQHLL
jgi:ribosome-binding protein aMBF1 (putative translation factor)